MDESKAIELYQFFNKEGYDLGDQENFLNSFDDEEKRKELYQFFNKEGYDVGNEEDFVLKKKDSDLPVQEEVTESITEVETPAISSESSLDPDIFREMTTEEKVATRKGTPYDDTEEKDTLIERTLGKNAVTDFLGDMYRAGATGYQQGQSVDEALEVLAKGSSVSDQDVEEYISAVQETGPYAESDEMKDFYNTYNEEGKGIFGVLKGLYNNPSILPEVLVSSTASMMNPATAAGGAAGAAGGAAVGSTGFSAGPLGVFTTLGGAISGFFGGATTTLETAMTFNELLREELGDKEFNKENIKEILNDPEKLSSLRFKSVGRGATIGTIDAMTAGLAGAVTKKVVKAGVKKGLAAAAGGGVEMVGGSLGEVGGKAVAGQEMDVADIFLEGAAGLGSAPLTVGAKLFSKNKPKYTINGGDASKEDVIGLVNSLNKDNIKETVAKIDIKNDPETSKLLQNKLDDISLETQIPANISNPETRTKLVELEKERKSLENNTTQSAKNRVIEIDNQIKNLQQDAIQEQETGDILDAEPAESVQEVEEEVREPSIETEEKIKIKSKPALDPVTKETIDSYELEGEEKENRLNFVEKQIEKDIQEEKSVKEIVQGIEKRLNIDKESKNKVTLYITDRVNKKTTQSFSEWNNSKPTPTEQTTEQEVKVYDNINDDLEVFGEFTKNVESGRDFGNLPGEVQNIVDLGQRLDEQGVTVEVTRDLGIVDGRQILEVTASNGEKFLMYKSKGTGTGAASKGKWVPLPGFAKDGYFIKGAFNPETGKTFIPTGPLSEANNPKFNKYGSETFKKLAEQLESETTVEETEVVKEETVKSETTEKIPEKEKKQYFVPGKNKIFNFLERARRSLFTKKKFLSKAAYDKVENRESQIAGDIDEMNNINKDYEKKLKKIKDPEQRKKIEEQLDRLFRGEEVDSKVDIPQELKDSLKEMRALIKRLSQKLLDDPYFTKGKPGMRAEIQDNLETYLTRAYKIYDSKNWKESVMRGDQEQVLNDAKNYLREQEKRLNPEATEERIEELVDLRVEDILEGKENDNWLFTSSDVTGQKSSELKKRNKFLNSNDVGAEKIRALMGEYTDVASNFVKSITKLASLTNTAEMLTNLRELGLKEGWLSTERTKEFSDIITNKPKLDKKGKPKTTVSEKFKPLEGLYSTPEIAAQFNNMQQNKTMTTGIDAIDKFLLEPYFKIVALNKYGKTILSPQTHAINFVSNMGFAFVNGHGDIKSFKEAYNAFHKDFNRDQYNKYIRLGIIDNNVQLKEIKALFKDANFEDGITSIIDKKSSNFTNKIKQIKDKGLRGFEKAYGAEDNFWKIFGFENELKRYADSEYGKKPSELNETELAKVEKIAAENVKNIYPNYGRVSDIVQKFRILPAAGSFVSFTYESYRTAYNTIKLGIKEMKSDNKNLQKAGRKRLMGAVTYLSARNALLYASTKGAGLAATGIILGTLSSDDEKDKTSLAKRYLYDFQKASSIAPQKVGDGVFEYVDVSASDPHGAIDKIINRISESENLEDAAINAFSQSILEPFLGGEMTANLISSVSKGEKLSGAPIYEKADQPEDKLYKTMEYVILQLQPGISKQAYKLYDAEDKLKTATEMMTGLKTYKLDIKDQFKYKVSNFQYKEESLRNIKRAYKKKIEGKTPQEIENIYKDFKKDYDESIKSFYLDYKAARDVFGVSAEDLYDIMKEKRLSESLISNIEENDLPTLSKDPDEKTTKTKKIKGSIKAR